MSFPRPVETIHQIELATYCNLRCKYCPYPKQEALRGQPKMYMDWTTFERAIEWAVALNGRYVPTPTTVDLVAAGRERGELVLPTGRPLEREPDPVMAELSLTGVGEALMHPQFVDMLAYARQRLPENPIVFSTNGILLTEELCARIAPYEPLVFVSLHRPEKAGHAIQAAKRHGILAGFNPAPAVSAFDWAGQVDWFVSHEVKPCDYLAKGWGVVLVDGRITTCCLDASAKGIVGHVDDPIGSAAMGPFELCETCSYTVPEQVV